MGAHLAPHDSEAMREGTPGPFHPAVASLGRLAAIACQAPFASIFMADGGVICWCTGSDVVSAERVPKHDPFVTCLAYEPGVLAIAELIDDPRFAREECVRGPLAVRAYAGVALRSADGRLKGTLAVYDTVVRRFAPRETEALLLVAQGAMALLELNPPRVACASPSELAARKQTDWAANAVTVIESAPVAMYQTDPAGNFTYINPEYRRIFGLDPEQSPEDWAQGVHPEERVRMEQAWADFCANPRPMSFEYRTTHRAGGVRHFTENVVPIDGARAFVGTISDVTDLLAARSDLRRVEALYRNTVEEAPVGIAYSDRSGRILRCNRAFGNLLGLSSAELEARTTLELTYLDDAAAADRAYHRLWQREVPAVEIEKRYLRKDGSALWVHATQSLVPQGEGASDCLVEFILDITARKRLSAELEEHKALLETLLANLPLALIACDAQGRVTHHNREAAELCSIDQNEVASDGYSVRAGVYHADGVTPLDRADRPLARTLRGEQVENMELVIIPQGASERVTVSNGRRLVGPDGRLMGALCVSQDITERRRAELELERVHEQLRGSARQAGMAEVATSILHNVGNVLTSINVCAALLGDGLKRSKAPDVGRVAALIREQGEKLGEFMTLDERGKVVPGYLQALGEQLVRDNEIALGHLATLRKSLEHVNHAVAMQQNHAKLTSVHETVSVVDLIEDSLRLSAGAFTRHGIELCREFEPTAPITVDKHKVLQILVNLMRNAQYACDESGKKHKLLTLRLTGDGQQVRISVIDNGIGIAPENMSRLFTHGFTTRASGHGFGLHSAAVAAQELGGSLHAESAGLGQGASFILELPRDPPTADPEPN